MKFHLKAKKYDVIRYHIQCDRLSCCSQYLKIGKIMLKDKLLDKCLWRVCYYHQVYHLYYNELLLWYAFIRFHLQILFLHKEDFHRHYCRYCFLGFHCLLKCHHLHFVCLRKPMTNFLNFSWLLNLWINVLISLFLSFFNLLTVWFLMNFYWTLIIYLLLGWAILNIFFLNRFVTLIFFRFFCWFFKNYLTISYLRFVGI